MKNNASFVYSFFLVIGDFLALVAAFVGGFLLRVTYSAKAIAQPVPARTYLLIFLTLAPFWILVFALLGLYNSNIYEKRFKEFGRLFIGSFIGLLFVIFCDFISSKPIFPAKLVPIYGFILALLFLVLFRTIARGIRITLFNYNRGISNVLIIGDTDIALELANSLRDSRKSGYHVVGVVSSRESAVQRFKHFHVYRSFSDAIENIPTDAIHSIVQTELYSDAEKNNVIFDFAQKHHIAYRFIPGNTELFVGNIQVELFRNSIPVIAVHQTPLIGWGRILKRIFDIVVSLIMIVITSPIMLIIAALEILSRSGSVFFRQTRLTRFNNEFRVFKFRTQFKKYDGTTPEQAFAMMGKPELSTKYRDNGDYLQKDPRVTRIGRFLRVTSLDELPQLFNVLRGDISLVGPRALIPEELNKYDKKHAILSVKSGLTGLAQVSGRRNISFDERRKLDIYYVQNWSFWNDLVILAKTVRLIISREGAQ